MLAISGAAIVVAAVAIAFLVLRRDPVAVTAALGSPTPRPSATRAPTRIPATPTPIEPSARPTAMTFSASEVDRLRQLVPSRLARSCVEGSFFPLDPAAAANVLATVSCQGGGSDRAVLYIRLADPGYMTSAYEAGLAESGMAYDSGGCWDGSPGEVSWAHGRATCLLDAGGSPTVVWTDERLSVGGQATSPTGSLQELVDWWWNSALLLEDSDGTGLTIHEQWLREQVPASFDCEGYDAVEDAEQHPKRKVVDPVGDVGAIDCDPGAKGVSDIGWFRFTTPEALDAWYLRRVALAGIALDSGGCYDGTEGETSWEQGRVMCYRQDGSGNAKIRWINYDTMTYGALNATNSNLPALFAWWRANGMP